jgi:hypothetical protein
VSYLSASLKVLTCAIFVMAFSSLAQAQATRTWVSGVGDDANPCSRTAPCKTFAGAISKTFINGEINAIDPGGFGAVTITKSITIDGGETFASILASGVNGVIINIAVNANDPKRRVTLRRLSINGTGASGTIGTSTGINGIRGTSNGFAQLNVENCYIQNFTTAGIDINFSTGGGGARVAVKDTTITNTGVGAQFSTTSGGFISGVLDNVKIEGMTTGVSVKDRSFMGLRNCVIQNCSTAGAAINAPSNQASLALENCYLFSVNVGVAGGGAGAVVDVSNTTITGSATGITNAGGIVNTHENNRIFGNSAAGTIPTPVGQQ